MGGPGCVAVGACGQLCKARAILAGNDEQTEVPATLRPFAIEGGADWSGPLGWIIVRGPIARASA